MANEVSKLDKPKFLDQRVSWNEKQTKKWYKPVIDSIIRECGTDINAIDNLYDGANGKISDQSVFNYVLKPFGESEIEVLKSFKFPGRIREDSLITPVVEKFMGEFIRQMLDPVVVSSSPDVENSFKQDLMNLYKKNLTNLMANTLNAGSLPIKMDESKVDAPKDIESFKAKWTSEEVKINQEALDYIRYNTDSDFLYVKCFYDWIVTGRTFTHREIIKGDIKKEHIPANQYYPSDNGADYVEDHNKGLRIKYMSIEDVVARFRDDLSDKELRYILKFYDYRDQSGIIRIPHADLASMQDGYFYHGGFYEHFKEGGSEVLDSKNGFIPIYFVHFTSERKIGIVTYRDEVGRLFSKYVDETYKKSDLDENVEWIYVPDRLEAARIGNEDIGVYVKPYRIEAQRFELNNIQETKSGYNGKLRLFPNAYDHSIVKRMLPFEILHKIFTLQLERIISKEVNNGRITVIPKSLLTSEGISEEQNIYYMTADGRVIVDDTEPNFVNMVNGFKVVDSRLGAIIGDLFKVRESIKQDAWDAVGWNRQRDGNIFASDGKANTEQAIYRSALSSILMFWAFDKFIERDYQADLDFAKFAWEEDDDGFIRKGGYIVSDRRSQFLKLNAKQFRNSSVGIFVENRAKLEDQIKALKDIGFSASQNGQISIAAEIVTSNNPEKIKEYISKLETINLQYQQSAAEAESARAKEELDRADAREKAKIDKDVYIADLNAQIEREKIQADKEIARIKSDDNSETNRVKERVEDKKGQVQRDISKDRNKN